MTAQATEPSALEDQLIEKAVGAAELFSIHIGRELELYEQLSVPRTPNQLAEAAGINPRYAREWLEHQAVGGFVTVENPDAGPDERVYRLPARNREVLIDPNSVIQVGPLADIIVGVGLVMDRVVDAYRTGDGVPFADYGRLIREGQANINRPAFKHDLTQSWIPQSVPDIHEKLKNGGRVADVGCGAGWSTIALGMAYPQAEVIGFDLDVASIEDAKANAASEMVEVVFRAADGAALAREGPFDLVLILEALHDMANPVEVLTNVRSSLAAGGALLVADELVADRFHPSGDLMERMMYGWSVIHCLPASMTEPGSAALGTVLRRSMLEELAGSAGFQTVETPDVDGGFFRIYVLKG